MAKKKTVRMNIELSHDLRRELERMSKESGLSMSGVIRRNIQIYNIIRSAQRDGAKIIVRTDDSEKELIIV